jgi:anti-sigma factor RsiW
MAEPTHTELRLSLGSYVLGSLDPADRAALDAHLPGCPACREELASYAALPALMSRLSIDQVRQPPPTGPPSMPTCPDAPPAGRSSPLTRPCPH